MNEIETRLRRIADYIDRKRGKRLTILFRTSDGGEQTGTVDDLIAAKGTFVRVLCGNSMDDLDRILRYEIPDYFCVID